MCLAVTKSPFSRPKGLFSQEKSSTPTGLVWDLNMAAVSLFWDTNMDAVSSCKNTIIDLFYFHDSISDPFRIQVSALKECLQRGK